ncbi:Osmosensing histidine protein kinase SLN1 [Yarrowia sp. E02]|nr:Osmosensing histidine protein kinase SLN1 [Yarrowia sp. E02]
MIVLVIVVITLSLLILAIVTGVKYTNSVLELRQERIKIVSMLKAAQLVQSVMAIYYQVQALANRDELQVAMARAKAGNNTDANWAATRTLMQSSLDSSSTFFQMEIYDRSLSTVLDMGGQVQYDLPGAGLVSGDTFYSGAAPNLSEFADIFPLRGASEVPVSLVEHGALIGGPRHFSRYPSNMNPVMSFTVPIYVNMSVLVDQRSLAGYLTVSCSANTVMDVSKSDSTSPVEKEGTVVLVEAVTPQDINRTGMVLVTQAPKREDVDRKKKRGLDKRGLEKRGLDKRGLEKRQMTVVAEEDDSASSQPDLADGNESPRRPMASPLESTDGIIVGNTNKSAPVPQTNYFRYIVAPYLTTAQTDQKAYSDDLYPPAQKALSSSTPNNLMTKNMIDEKISAGYAPVDLLFASWAVIVEEPQKEVYSSINRLKNIVIGAAIGLAFLTVILTFPIAAYVVRPIIRLQKATEHTAYKYRTVEKDDSSPNPPENSPVTSSTDVGSGHFDLEDPSNSASSRTSTSWWKHARSLGMKILRTLGMTRFTAEALDLHGHEGYIEVHPVVVEDELTELTQTFNTMTEELHKQYSIMEQRVAQRTLELEAARVQAESANEAKTLFIANITHELRTPLNGILGMTSVSLSEKDAKKIGKSLKVIFKSGELLLHLLTDLLTFSKSQVGRMVLDEREFVFHEILSQISAIFVKQARDHGVRLTVTVEPPEVSNFVFLGDSNRMLQVMINLISNSLKFTPVGGQVELRIKSHGEFDPGATASTGNERLVVKEEQPPQEKMVLDLNSGEMFTESPISYFRMANNEAHSKSEPHTPLATVDEVSSGFPTSANSVATPMVVYTPQSNTTPSEERPGCSHSGSSGGLRAAPKGQSQRFEQPRTLVMEFEVEDNGPGIAEHLQERVFELFVQGEQALSRTHGGTGLGLSICKQLTAMMGGHMTLKSKVGEGSTFTVQIPLKQMGIIGKENAYSGSSGGGGSGGGSGSGSSSQSPLGVVHPDKPRYSPSAFTYGGTAMRRAELVSFSSDDDDDDDDEEEEDGVSRAEGGAGGGVGEGGGEAGVGGEGGVGVGTGGPGGAGIPSLAVSGPSPVVALPPKSESSYFALPVEERARILVAEDNIVNQQVIRRMLKLEDIPHIVLANDGEQAVAKVREAMAQQKPFDLVFMDVQMPKMDGIAATRFIRNELGYTHPIVALTAFNDDENAKSCKEAGMSGFLSKPIRRSALHETLVKFCPTKAFVEPARTPNRDI